LMLCLLHVVLPVGIIPLWMILNIAAISILYILSELTFSQLIKRNILIVSFALMLAFFQVVSSVIAGTPVDHEFMGVTFARIFFVYNMIMTSMAWMGKSGFLWLVHTVKSERIRLFLLLFSRTVHMFIKRNRHIIFQLQSRIDTGSRKKYLVPRYYVQNLVAGELYSLQHYQAGLITRVHGNISVLPPDTISRRHIPAALCIMLLMVSGIIIVFI
ncbi:MAG TPA: hypothetical protein VKQ10_01375, partial [Spirochaetota bacterium]|nr:hypothetical protein [Spirochaetota bacterium]